MADSREVIKTGRVGRWMGVKKVISLTVHWTALLVSTHSQLELGGVANCLLPKTKRRKRIRQGKKEMTRVTMGPSVHQWNRREVAWEDPRAPAKSQFDEKWRVAFSWSVISIRHDLFGVQNRSLNRENTARASSSSLVGRSQSCERRDWARELRNWGIEEYDIGSTVLRCYCDTVGTR